MEVAKLLEAVRDLVRLQTLLVQAFHSAFPNVRDWQCLLDAPKNGCIAVGEHLWLF